jgi:hypothetical protein
MQIILSNNEKKWAKVIGLTALIYFIIYKVNKQK